MSEVKAGIPLRTIKSFVIRVGRMTTAQKQAFDANWPLHGLHVEEGQLDQLAVFGRNAPLVFEIGFGMGQSLIEMAQAQQLMSEYDRFDPEGKRIVLNLFALANVEDTALAERIAKLDELEYPKPQREFVYNTFNAFVVMHPWVEQENIRPKSIVREMVENYVDFAGYIKLYDLERSEGVLLRHIASVHKVLAQTVPPAFKNEDVQEVEDWLAGLLRGTDSSLLDEWERLKNPAWQAAENDVTKAPEVIDITRNKREFTALIRTDIFHFLRALAAADERNLI